MQDDPSGPPPQPDPEAAAPRRRSGWLFWPIYVTCVSGYLLLARPWRLWLEPHEQSDQLGVELHSTDEPFPALGTPGSIVAMRGPELAQWPEGWLPCDGRDLLATDYPALYRRLSGTGGEMTPGQRFRLPDLRGLGVEDLQGSRWIMADRLQLLAAQPAEGDERLHPVHWFVQARDSAVPGDGRRTTAPADSHR